LESLPSLAGVPVFVENDAKALALGEGWAGSGRGVSNFMAMVVSTGIGGGIVLDGRVLEGRSGNAGHIGHVIVEPAGRHCRCGSRGCLEAEVSGSAIEEITGRPAAEAPPEIVERTGMLVGRAIASAANLLDFRLALVGGSVALGYGTSFFAAAQREVDERARISYVKGCLVQTVGLGAAGPLIGAAGVGWRGIGRLVPVPVAEDAA
jgi:glucokinase